jgi:DnaK suppressor protein
LKEIDVTAAKRAPAPAPKKPATAAKKSAASAKKTTAAKRTVSVSKKAPAKKAVTKRPAVEAKRTATTTKKAAPKRPAPAAKKSAAAPKKAAPKKVVATKKPAPAPPKRPTVGPYAKEAKFLDEQRALLLEERSIYSGQAVDLRAEADSLALEREPGDVQFDEESGEGGTVEEIDDALRKIERKTYGGCERCYQAIPKARLRALPFARLCVACKSGGLSRR